MAKAPAEPDVNSAAWHEAEALRLNEQANALDHMTSPTVQWEAIMPNLEKQDLRQRSIYHATMAVAARLAETRHIKVGTELT